MNLYKSIQKILRNWAHGGYNRDETDVFMVLKNELKKHTMCVNCTLQKDMDDIQNSDKVCLDKRYKKKKKTWS